MAKRKTKLQQLQASGPPSRTGRATEAICNDFLDYLRGECHLAANTILAYGRDMRRFVGWLGKKRLSNLTVQSLSDYVATLNDEGLSPASVSRKHRRHPNVLQVPATRRDRSRKPGPSCSPPRRCGTAFPASSLMPRLTRSWLRHARPTVTGNATWRCSRYCTRPVVEPPKSAPFACETCRWTNDRSAARAKEENSDWSRSGPAPSRRSNRTVSNCEGSWPPTARSRPKSCSCHATAARWTESSFGGW